MPFIIWGPKVEVGIQLVDEQHHRLVDITNDLYDAVQSNYAEEIIVGIFVELIEYTESHFRAEEELMKRHHMPLERLKYHLEEHKIFTDRIKSYLNEYIEGDAEVSIDVLIYLRDWLIEHIVTTDLKDLSLIRAQLDNISQ